MDPGTIYAIEVDMGSTSYIWNTGHRIRVEVSSSNYPRFLNNPNTVDAIGENTTCTIAQNVVYVDTDHPSCIILPEPLQHITQTIRLKPEGTAARSIHPHFFFFD